MKATLKILSISFGLFFIFSGLVHAEIIKKFNSQITVNKDSSVSVIETITYDSESVLKHGIYRDITPISAQGKKLLIKDISVTDAAGVQYQWQQQTNNGDIRLKIGDPNATFVGEKTYIIRYTAISAISYLDAYDEIYWDATGNKWPFSIQQASASVILPDATKPLQQACYVGQQGSTTPCAVDQTFNASNLQAGEGLTIAVGFPKGTVTIYKPSAKEKLTGFFFTFWPLLIPILVFLYMFQRWYRIGRDAKGKGMIVPEYDVADALTPLEASMILNQEIVARDIVAEILYLATKGYISITRTEEKKFLSTKVEYTLRLDKIPDVEVSAADTYILTNLFMPRHKFDTQNITLADLKKLATNYKTPSVESLTIGSEISLSENPVIIGLVTRLQDMIRTSVVEKEYYTKDFLPKKWATKKYIGLIAAFVVISFLVTFTNILESVASLLFSNAEDLTILLFVIAVVVSIGIVYFFGMIMPAKTKKGAIVREHLLGLKEYIQVAEKDRIAFHNAPERNPALFEHLLPYAIMFGLEKKWARVFESSLTTPPVWYHADTGSFAAVAFTSDLRNTFSSAIYSSLGTSGGSGGGGSSGGGGGGGGGGSW